MGRTWNEQSEDGGHGAHGAHGVEVLCLSDHHCESIHGQEVRRSMSDLGGRAPCALDLFLEAMIGPG